MGLGAAPAGVCEGLTPFLGPPLFFWGSPLLFGRVLCELGWGDPKSFFGGVSTPMAWCWVEIRAAPALICEGLTPFWGVPHLFGGPLWFWGVPDFGGHPKSLGGRGGQHPQDSVLNGDQGSPSTPLRGFTLLLGVPSTFGGSPVLFKGSPTLWVTPFVGSPPFVGCPSVWGCPF